MYYPYSDNQSTIIWDRPFGRSHFSVLRKKLSFIKGIEGEDVMEDDMDMLDNSIKSIQRITTIIYQQKYQDGMKEARTLLDELVILSSILFVRNKEENTLEFEQDKFLAILLSAMNALEAKDEVLFADILKYELIDFLQKQKVEL